MTNSTNEHDHEARFNRIETALECFANLVQEERDQRTKEFDALSDAVLTTNQHIGQMADTMRQFSQMMRDVSKMTGDLSQTTGQVSQTVGDLSQATRQVMESVEQVSEDVRSLTAEMNQLRAIVMTYMRNQQRDDVSE